MFRSSGHALIACIAVALTLAPAASGHSQTPKNEFAGLVAEDIFGGTASYRAKAIEKVASTRVGTLRQAMDWALIEPTRGRYDWRRFDAFVAAAAGEGIRVMPIVFNAPAWASAKPRRGAKRGTYPPRDFAAFAGFAAAAARRYGPNGTFWPAHRWLRPLPITAWQIWNEQNLSIYWQPRPSATRYVAMLRETSRAIKAVDPAAEIVTGGMPDSRLGIGLERYVGQLYAAGGADAFDTIAVNPYARDATGVLAFMRGVRRVMNANRDSEGALRATEIGWSDSGPRNSFRLGAKGQANAIGEVLRTLHGQRAALNLRGVVYYNWRDARPYPGGKEFWGLHTGLLRKNGSAKPAYKAFQAAITALP